MARISTSNWQIDIFNMFRELKLGSSHFKSQVQWVHRVGDTMEARLKNELTHNLASFIFSQHPSSITHKEEDAVHGERVHTYSAELMVMKMEEFKTCVEAVIQLLPEDVIQKIKQGEQITIAK